MTAPPSRWSFFAKASVYSLSRLRSRKKRFPFLRSALSFAQERVLRKEQSLERSQALYEKRLKPLDDILSEEDTLDTLRAAATNAEVRLAEAQNSLRLAQSARDEEKLTLREEMLTQTNGVGERSVHS